MISLRQRILWTGVLASAAFAASAQTPPAASAVPADPQAQSAPAPAAKAQQHHRAGHHKDFAQRFERMQQHRAKRLAALKDKLQLTAQQQGAWDSYTAALQPATPHKPEEIRARRAEFAKLTTPQRLERMQARQAERSAMFTKRADATKAFYAQLSPEQQKTFDAQSMRGGHRGHPGAHARGHHPKADAATAPAKG